MDLFFFKTLLPLLSFLGCCAGQTILQAKEIDAVLGKNVTFKTTIKIPDYKFIVWNFNDGSTVNVLTKTKDTLEVHDRYTGRVTLNTTDGSLTVGPLTPEDSGDYDIVVLTKETLTAAIKLRVLEPVSDVAIKANLPEAIEHNSTLVLTCSAKGSFLEFSWFKGAAPIMATDKRFSMKTEELSSNLTITDVLRTDMLDPIYCQASNKLEMEKSAAFNLTVYYGPDEVTITPLKPPQFISSNANFSLSCSSRSSPPATFSWYHNQKQMEIAGPILTLENIKAHKFGSEDGEYTCMAKNDKTKRNVNSTAVSFAVIDAMLSAKISGPTATLMAGNSSANLSCQGTGGTVKTVTWLKDNKPLPAGGRVLFFANMTSVAISPLQKEDNGVYTCQLMNPINTVEASYKMMVNYGPEQVAVTADEAVEVTDKITLICSAASIPPANYTWKFNGTLTNIKTDKYLIEMARYKNTGTYMCEAHNSVTGKNSSASHFLSVKEEGALDEGLSDGAIAGIVIAVPVALGAAIGLIVYCRQKVPVESPY